MSAMPESIPNQKLVSVRFDRGLCAAAVSLVLLGLVMIASASVDVAEARNSDAFHYVQRHGIFIVLAMISAVIAYCIPIDWWKRNAFLLLCIALFLLCVVLIPGLGKTVNGSTRWISLGGLNIQPSEIAKLFLVAYLASYLVRRHEEVQSSWWGFTKPMLVLSVAALFLLAEPDFGATVVIGCAFVGMIFLSGARLSQFIVLILICVGLVVLMVFTQPYRVARLTGYRDPWADQFGAGYQLTQSLIAFGRGEWFGVGLGNSVQKQFYLPEAHTDFVFAIFAEEFGLLGTLLLVCLFAYLIYRAFDIARQSEKVGLLFHAFFAYGIAMLISIQAVINMGVNMGLLPTKGLTLPLVSYGGSSLIVSAVAIAILLRIYSDLIQVTARDSKEGRHA
jgi:cell division protein FtsW